jgi:endonuclease/exonuclease/phosphatase family metal-dependent hydrolase
MCLPGQRLAALCYNPAMRLVTWNSPSGVSRNWATIKGFDADILTVQEAEPGTKAFVEGHPGWSCEWQVGRHLNGVAVLAREPYRIEDVERSGRCYLSTIVGGPRGYQFRFVGFWGMTKTGTDDGYPQQAKQLIENLAWDEVATVVAGDFNASSRNDQHVENVASLGAHGLVNAYEAVHGVAVAYPGDHPTSYHQWKETQPHHMDHVFIPSTWNIEDVHVGTFAEYAATGQSDHMPVTVVADPSYGGDVRH